MSVAYEPLQGWGPYTIEDLHEAPEDGKGFELWNGWLIEKKAFSVRHNAVSSALREVFIAAARQAGADVFVDGSEYEFAVSSGVRKPDVFVIDTDAIHAACAADEILLDPADTLLVAEVVSRHSGSEAHDRVVKRAEYARSGVPRYWIVDFRPVPRIEVLERNEKGVYETTQIAVDDQALTVTEPFEITVVPADLLGLGGR
ncbi:hypothetical protein DPM19_24650 [Actinomadura craniellae]|uniref:Putative restriction endonuclease domain-containing protein n=1 Tax=Actinomadura craniellae TaxID=2231787 RepID=A0A365GZS7_9ACTN|nr:Uma2 family endonuclease [Actinomadura craniellae]RAY12345.1 hypothetical protein DPM19_24650 [Actinomadura craniellae]